ncbi:hypothetical protein A3K64_00370 [Candidatus Micrarchaeota archaeon RBG_16_36_9]|nr:MAG: hypothetical protein A3K64_00370 [Candidatus Micrarchaeota archaeon RBG_16_36_9]
MLESLRERFQTTSKTYAGKIIDIVLVKIPYVISDSEGLPLQIYPIDMPRFLIRTEMGDKITPIKSGLEVNDQVLLKETSDIFGKNIQLEKVTNR